MLWLTLAFAATLTCEKNHVWVQDEGRRTYLPGVSCDVIARAEFLSEGGPRLVVRPEEEKPGRVVFFDAYKEGALLYALSYAITTDEALQRARAGDLRYFLPTPAPTPAPTDPP